jgi:phosphoglycolate phosphatase
MRYHGTIVFDLDGTLVDTAPDLTASLNHALAELGQPGVSPAAVRAMVGQGAYKLLEHATGDPALADAGLQLFLDHYAAHIADQSRPFPGVEAALDALAAAGCRLAVCTNKRQSMTDLLIETLNWSGRFHAVVGADSVPNRKPDPGHVWAAVEAAGGRRDDAAFVGDSITDARAAQAAGLPLVLVSFGYTDEPVAAMGADAVIDHYDDLLPTLAGFKARSSTVA